MVKWFKKYCKLHYLIKADLWKSLIEWVKYFGLLTHCETTYTHFAEFPPSYLLPNLFSMTLQFFWNHVILFKIHLLLRTSWLSVWKKYFFLTQEHNHLNSTEIPEKQNRTKQNLGPPYTILLSQQTSLYICFLSKEYYQKKLPNSDPLLLSISFLN